MAYAGAAAAAEHRRRQQEEEEEMTDYTPEDLRDEWEFKIVRSAFESFRDPHKLKQMLKEEAEAGWVLVEKFDNGRVRLKRPASARKQDHLLPRDVDPYRTNYGAGQFALAMVIIGVIVAVMLGIMLPIILLSG